MSGYNIKAIDAELECLNGRIADRNATIAAQAAEIERRGHENYALKEQLKRNVEGFNSILLELNILRRYASPEVSLKIQEARAALQPKEGE